MIERLEISRKLDELNKEKLDLLNKLEEVHNMIRDLYYRAGYEDGLDKGYKEGFREAEDMRGME